MKKPLNPVIPDYTPRSERNKKEEISLTFNPCINCGKKITEGYYGRWSDSGTCSKSCEMQQVKKERYPPPKGDDHVPVSKREDPIATG